MKSKPKVKANTRFYDSKAGTTKSAASTDVSGGKLRSLGRLLGNQGLDQRVSNADTRQTALVDFVIGRLENICQVQQTELQEIQNIRHWFREAAKGTEGYSLPDASRWHECAHLYKQAVEALCRGDLGRGAEILERAIAEETDAQKSTPIQVKNHLEESVIASVSTPKSAASLSTAAVCNPIQPPITLKLADQIRNISDEMTAVPPIPISRKTNWWEEEESEEEEEEDEG